MVDFKELQTKHPERAKRLKKMEAAGKKAAILKDLKEHAGVQMISERLVQNINVINEKLLYTADLSETDRRCLLVERDSWKWLLDQFDVADQAIEKINKFIKKL